MRKDNGTTNYTTGATVEDAGKGTDWELVGLVREAEAEVWRLEVEECKALAAYHQARRATTAMLKKMEELKARSV